MGEAHGVVSSIPGEPLSLDPVHPLCIAVCKPSTRNALQAQRSGWINSASAGVFLGTTKDGPGVEVPRIGTNLKPFAVAGGSAGAFDDLGKSSAENFSLALLSLQTSRGPVTTAS